MTVIDIEYSYDLSGTVQIAGRVRDRGQPLPLTVEPLPADVPARFLCPPEETAVAVHVTAYLAFDLSGSMGGAPLREAQKAALGFLENTDLTHASIGVIAFADSVHVKLPASQNAREIARAIQSLAIGEVGGCNSAHPFDDVRSLLRDVDPPKFVITLADGVWACQDEAERSARAAVSEAVESIAIGFGSADRKFLKAIASSDEASFFTTLSGLVETFANIAQVLTESQGDTVGQTAAKPARLSFLDRLRR